MLAAGIEKLLADSSADVQQSALSFFVPYFCRDLPPAQRSSSAPTATSLAGLPSQLYQMISCCLDWRERLRWALSCRRSWKAYTEALAVERAPYLQSIANLMRDTNVSIRSEALSCFRKISVAEMDTLTINFSVGLFSELLQDTDDAFRDQALCFFEREWDNLPAASTALIIGAIAKLMHSPNRSLQCAAFSFFSTRLPAETGAAHMAEQLQGPHAKEALLFLNAQRSVKFSANIIEHVAELLDSNANDDVRDVALSFFHWLPVDASAPFVDIITRASARVSCACLLELADDDRLLSLMEAETEDEEDEEDE